MRSPLSNFAVRFATVVACSALLVLTTAIVMRARASTHHAVRAAPTAPRRVANGGQLRSGTQVVAVFFADSACDACHTEGLTQSVATINNALAHRSALQGQQFWRVGVSLDWWPDVGMRFLDRFGTFDEISAGRNWLNSAAVHYIWRDVAGPPAVPQLVVVERDVRVDPQGISFGDERLVTRKVGIDEISRWSAALADSVDSPPSPTPVTSATGTVGPPK